MPTLNWIGKDKVINHHLDVPFHTLDKQYTVGDSDSGNKIINGDNLVALKALLPEYEGKIKCIYIDPPYNTGNEGWIYNDNVNAPQIKRWLGQVVGNEGEDLSRHDKWLCMMYPRLQLLHKLLADDGAIFISIDDNEQANLKLLCDEIFGERNFLTQFIWQKKTGASDAKNIASITEYIICFVKDIDKIVMRKNTESYDLKRYKYKDEFYDIRGPYYIDNLDRGGLQYSDSLNYGIKCPNGTMAFPNGRVEYENDGWIWKWSKNKIEWAIENKFIEFRKSTTKKCGWSICYKNYLYVDNENNPINRAAPHKNLILDVLNAHAAADIKEIYGQLLFPYSKPVDLVKHFINISTDKSSIILDSFAGSGTTAHAVLNLNKKDGGNRKFILVEMEDYAETITAERVKRVINGYGEGDKAVEGTGGGFDYFSLGKTIFNADGNLNEDVGVEKIREYIWYSETGTSLPSHLNEYFLGSYNATDYYFFYEQNEETILTRENIGTIIKQKAEGYIIYADACQIEKKFMEALQAAKQKAASENQDLQNWMSFATVLQTMSRQWHIENFGSREV